MHSDKGLGLGTILQLLSSQALGYSQQLYCLGALEDQQCVVEVVKTKLSQDTSSEIKDVIV